MEEYSTRQNKVSRLIQKELANYFLIESKNQFRGKLISVTTVRITKDLGIARAYLSIFPNDKSDEVLESINAKSRQIRGVVGRIVGKQLRVVPELEFFIDDSLDYIDNIDRLLNTDS